MRVPGFPADPSGQDIFWVLDKVVSESDIYPNLAIVTLLIIVGHRIPQASSLSCIHHHKLEDIPAFTNQYLNRSPCYYLRVGADGICGNEGKAVQMPAYVRFRWWLCPTYADPGSDASCFLPRNSTSMAHLCRLFPSLLRRFATNQR